MHGRAELLDTVSVELFDTVEVSAGAPSARTETHAPSDSSQTRMHKTHMRTMSHTHIHTHIHTMTIIHTDTHAHMHTPKTHVHTHTHTHTHTHAHARARTRTHSSNRLGLWLNALPHYKMASIASGPAGRLPHDADRRGPPAPAPAAAELRWPGSSRIPARGQQPGSSAARWLQSPRIVVRCGPATWNGTGTCSGRRRAEVASACSNLM